MQADRTVRVVDAKAAALALKNEHEKEYMFYSTQLRAGFLRRLRNLAQILSIVDECDHFATLCLDIVATRLNVNLTFKDS